MNATARILLTAVLCTAAVACSKKVKETPPVDTGAGTAPVTSTPPSTTPGMYGTEDLDTDRSGRLNHRVLRVTSPCDRWNRPVPGCLRRWEALGCR